MDFLSQGRPPLELALDISSRSRYCPVYHTYFLSTYVLHECYRISKSHSVLERN